MGKQGPCYHCGVTSTPLWRNGPPEKPVLCNACGSRWRTKGSLENYTPLHARAEPDDYEDHTRVKSISLNKNKEIKVLKRKQNHDNDAGVGIDFDYNLGFRKVVDEDTSNRSSSGSAISNSESCAQFGSADASDLTGPAQSVVWDSTVPSRKRTCVSRSKVSPVEKLTKDLYTILHEQQSSHFSGSSDEDLLFESETPMVSVEIGHGSVLIRHPNSIGREEESEASSLSVDNKQYPINEAYSHSMIVSVNNDKKGVNSQSYGINKFKNPVSQGMQHELLKRDKSHREKFQILGHHNSPLCHVDLKDVVNFEEFARHLTNEEQQQLLKYLPLVDTSKLPDSVRDPRGNQNIPIELSSTLGSMFESSQFQENFSSFQQLLAEGVFDISSSGAKTEECKNLKRLALCSVQKSKWVERYHLLKKCKNSTVEPHVAGVPKGIALNNFGNLKRSSDSQTQRFPEAKTMMKSPKRVVTKATYEHKELIDNDGSCFSPRSLFALPPDSSSLMLDSFHFADESSDQGLLLEVPSNNSFPQAELLHPTSSFGTEQASNSSSTIYPHRVLP